MTPHYIVVGNLGRESANDTTFGPPHKESPVACEARTGQDGIASVVAASVALRSRFSIATARHAGAAPDDGKRFATVQARAALAGRSLERELGIDGCCRWHLNLADGRARIASSLTEVEALLMPANGAGQVGGAA